jgi:BASS family bile acid:Na+ symporter
MTDFMRRNQTSTDVTRTIAHIQHTIHKYFIWLVITSYVAAAFVPWLGLWIREVNFGNAHLLGADLHFSLPPILLGLLLFNAGIGLKTSELKDLLHYPRLLLVGFLGNLGIPLAFIASISFTMTLWHNPDEVQQILTGLALIASMPIAGASTAWSQNANGNLALSLGLVLMTTLLSPALTPLALHTGGLLTNGDYSEDLHEIAANGAIGFLGAWVIVPSILGIALGGAIGAKSTARASPYLKFANSIILLLLNYSNASISLPNVFASPDLDFIAIMVVIVGLLCLTMFGSGYLIARAFGVDRSGTASLMFGLGMNNNGAGLVLASLTLTDHPGVMLPIIFYNLIQHLMAAFVDKFLSRIAQPHANIERGAAA